MAEEGNSSRDSYIYIVGSYARVPPEASVQVFGLALAESSLAYHEYTILHDFFPYELRSDVVRFNYYREINWPLNQNLSPHTSEIPKANIIVSSVIENRFHLSYVCAVQPKMQ